MLIAVDAETLTETSLDPWHLIGAVLVLIAGWILSRLTRRAARKVLARLGGLSDALRDLIARVLGYLVLFLGIGIALALVGVPIQPVLSAAIIVGVILALALRGLADNFAAGIILQTEQPIHVGDEIDSLDHSGIVKELTSRAVVVETFDGRTVHLPNGEVLSNPLINHTTLGARRSELEVRVYTTEVATMTDRLRSATLGSPDILGDPAPAVYVVAIEPDRVTYKVLYWHLPSNQFSATSDLVSTLGAALEDHTASVIAPRPVAPLTPPAAI
jgi:small-conductance mechanosensitive channel